MTSAFVDPEDSAIILCNACRCRLIDADTMTTPCGHFVCGACAKQSLYTKFPFPCPGCTLGVGSMRRVDMVLVRIVESRKVRCLFPSCDWKGVYGQSGSEYAAHCKVCPCAPWECLECKTTLTRGQSQSHLEQCPNRKVKCVHGCGVELSVADREAHDQTCINVTLTCPFAVWGCNSQFRRADKTKHYVRCMDQHHDLIFARVAALETQVAALQKPPPAAAVVPMEVKAADSSDNSTVDDESVGPPPTKRRGPGRPRKLRLSDDPEWEPPHKIRVPKPTQRVLSLRPPL